MQSGTCCVVLVHRLSCLLLWVCAARLRGISNLFCWWRWRGLMPHGGLDEIPRVGVSSLLLGCCTRCSVNCSVNTCIRTMWPVLCVVEIISPWIGCCDIVRQYPRP
ncbi:unnamed protein product [Ectocarpus sp. 12 AP-2014]